MSNPIATPSLASNVKDSVIDNDLSVFIDKEAVDSVTRVERIKVTVFPVITENPPNYSMGAIAVPIAITSATQRIGQPISRKTVSQKSYEELDVGGTRIGAVTVHNNESGIPADTSLIDGLRQGKNIETIEQFGKGLLPRLSINAGGVINKDGTIKNKMERVNYGQGSLFKIFDDTKRKLIPFDDFPGRLDPVAFVRVGNYIHQYMIITDLTRDVDQFINPDHMDGVIEVFEVRRQAANTRISDIQVNGIRCDLVTGDWNFDQKGSSIVDTKYEKVQSKYDYFEDAQELLFGDTLFHSKSYIETNLPAGSSYRFSIPGYVSDGQYDISPFNEAGDTLKDQNINSLRRFFALNGVSYAASIDSERSFSDIGSRYTSANTGFIIASNAVSGSVSGIKTNLGVDSVAFGGFLK